MKDLSPSRTAFAFSATQSFFWRDPAWESLDLESEGILEECDEIVQKHAGWSIRPYFFELSPDELIKDIKLCYPLLISLQVITFELLRSRGIDADAVLGLCGGETAAAYSAGVLSLEDTLRLGIHTSRILEQNTREFRMLMIHLPLDRCEEEIAPFPDQLTIGGIVSPGRTIVSGFKKPIEELMERLKTAGVTVYPPALDWGAHHPWVSPLRTSFYENLEGLSPRPPTRRLMSTVLGDWMDGDIPLGLDYWWQQVCTPALIMKSVEKLMSEGYDLFLEVGTESTVANVVPEFGGEVIFSKEILLPEAATC